MADVVTSGRPGRGGAALSGFGQQESPDALYRRAASAIRDERGDEVLPALTVAVEQFPQNARLWQVKGLAHRQRDEFAPAIQAFRRAAELAPRDALIAHSLARCLLEAGQPSSDAFDRAHALAPLDASVLLGRAAARFAEGQVQRAIAELDHQLDQHPGWVEGQGTVAKLRWSCGKRDAFTSALDRAHRIAPRETPLWQTHINLLMDAGQFDAALALLERARAAAGSDATFDMLEAIIHAEMGHREEADRGFAALMPLRHINVAIRYIRHLLRHGRADEAARAAEPWLADPQAALIWPYMALAWRLTGDPRHAWLEGDPRLVGVYDLGLAPAELDALADRLRSIHIALHQPLEQSLRGGTQTDGPLFSRLEPEIRDLRGRIGAAVEQHVSQLPPPDPRHPVLSVPRDRPLRFAGSWSVRLKDAGFHIAHVHPAGWLSSACYIALPDTLGGEGRAGWLDLGACPELLPDLPPLRSVEPLPGRLVLFPSIMWHGTRPFSAGERLTVAFDIAPPAR